MVTGSPQCGQLHVAAGRGAGSGPGGAFGVAGAAWRLPLRSQAAPQHFLEQ